MDVVHPRCAGLDVSKRDVKVCVRIQKPGRARATSTGTTWGAVTNRILALRVHLIAEEVTLVVMEATSDYWKPFYYLLDDGPFEIMLVNARHVKNLPGRKSDVSDAAWLAQRRADLAQASGTVGSAMGDYLFSHPDVNNFFTGLRGQPNEEIHGDVQKYMNANPQVESEINGIRQPLTDLKNRCDYQPNLGQ